jgi:hypothetical protein
VVARKSAAKKMNQSNARRRRVWRGKGAIIKGVCAGFEKKPMAQRDWEVQDRGSRTRIAGVRDRVLPRRHREYEIITKDLDSRKRVERVPLRNCRARLVRPHKNDIFLRAFFASRYAEHAD